MAEQTTDLATEKPDNDTELHEWALALVDDGVERRRAQEGQWWENIATYVGEFWIEYDVHAKRLREPVPKPDHKVRIPINLAQPVVRTELAKLVKNRPITDVMAKSADRKDLKAAEVADKILNNDVERRFHLPKVRRRALHWVLMCGLGGIFVDYDESADAPINVYQAANGEPIFDQRVIDAYKDYYKKQKKAPKMMQVPQGELRIIPASPFAVMWDFAVNYIEDAWWCIFSEVLDVNVIEKRWGKAVEGEDDALPGVIESRLLSRMDLTTGSNRLQLRHPTAQKLATVHRLFIKPGHPWFPHGAHIVFTKDQLIKKENYPFSHGQLPVSMMGHIPLPVQQHPMSVLSQVRGPVIELSKTVSQLIENRNLMANPPWLVAAQHQIDGEIQNKPGMRLTFNFVPNIPEPHPIQMPEIPSYVRELIPTMREHVLEISGQGETTQGRVPPGARSGVAIAYLQEEDDTRLGPTVQEFEEMIERVSSQILEVIAEKYTVPRTVQIYREHSEPEVFDFVGRMIEGNTNVVCQAGSALPRSKAAKQQYILDLWDRQLETDPRRVRRWLELNEGEPEQYELELQHAERELEKLKRGEEVRVEDWHNHAAHHYVVRRYMISPEFEELDTEIQQNVRDHDQEHTAAEQRVQQDQMMQQLQGQLAQEFMGAGGGGMMPQQNGGPPAANGMNVPEGAPPQFTGSTTPRDLMDQTPQ